MAEKRTKEEVEKRGQELTEELDKLARRAKEIKEEIGKIETRSRELNEETDGLDARSLDIVGELENLKNEERMTEVKLPETGDGQSIEDMRRTMKELRDRVEQLGEEARRPRRHGPMIVKYGLPDAPRAHLLKFSDGRTKTLENEAAVNAWINDPANEQPVEIWEMKKRTKVPATAKV